MASADYGCPGSVQRSPKNAKRLRGALEQLRDGKGTARKLPELK